MHTINWKHLCKHESLDPTSVSYGPVYFGSRRAEECKSLRRNEFTYKSPSPSLKITVLTTTHFKKELQIFVLVLLHWAALLSEVCCKHCKTSGMLRINAHLSCTVSCSSAT